MHSAKLTIQYDGTNYFGWQRQDSLDTIQGEIEKALFKIYKQSVNLVAAGRTDRGVHALNQVAHFRVGKYLDAKVIKKALNSLLPKDIRIIDSKECAADFHARFKARQREYKYIIYNADFCPPFLRDYRLFVSGAIDCKSLNSILQCFKGEHDFSSFTVFSEPYYSRTRNIYDIGARREEEEIIIWIRANSFLRKMVRMLVGACLHLSLKGRSSGARAELERLLKIKNRKLNKYPTVPAQGLFLSRIWY